MPGRNELKTGNPESTPRWKIQRFSELSRDELYAILAAREAVFVVEQSCPYQDVDGKDPIAWHVTGWSPSGKVLAYARVLPPGVRFPEPSIGRVLTAAPARACGLGRELMAQAMRVAEREYPGLGIRISAQQYLEDFYHSLGFRTIRGPYPEDGIPHVEMHRSEQREG